MLFLTVVGPFVQTPPPTPPPVFPVIVELVIVSVPPLLKMLPPDEPRVLLPEIVVLVMLVLPPVIRIAPRKALFPENVQPIMFQVPPAPR